MQCNINTQQAKSKTDPQNAHVSHQAKKEQKHAKHAHVSQAKKEQKHAKHAHVSQKNKKHVFSPFTPLGCSDARRPIWALPNGIDGCIIKQANGLGLDLDRVSASDKKQLAARVKKNCAKADESITDHRQFCVTKPVRDALWDAGACQSKGGFPNLANDGRLICSKQYCCCDVDIPTGGGLCPCWSEGSSPC